VIGPLFPRLARGSRAPLEAAFTLSLLVLIILAAAGLQAPLIAVTVLAVPLLFVIYVFQAEPFESRLGVAIIFAVGAALGVAWGLVAGPIVASSLLPGYATSMAAGSVLQAGVAVPLIGQLLMLAPAMAAWLWRPPAHGALDGFTAGAVGALGLTTAATLTELAPLLRYGNLVTGSSALSTVTLAVIRGVSLPLISAALTGYVAATLWSRRDRASTAPRRWLASPVAALAAAVVVQVGLGLADEATLPDAFGLVVHLVATVAALLVLRAGLHHVLLHELSGAAERPGTARRGGLGHTAVLTIVGAALVVVGGVLAVVAVFVPPASAAPCTALRCFAPFGPVPPHPPHVYAAGRGWTVQWYPASAVFPRAPQTTAHASPGQLRLEFTSPGNPSLDGELAFAGFPAQGMSPKQIVGALQRANAPNAVPDYVLPGASVGYVPGYGQAFETTPGSSIGNPVRFEVVISCAVRQQLAICAYAAGPQVNLNAIVNHPTPSKLALSLWSDPDVNGVRWPRG
jgi:hypothetical protein